MVIFGGILLLGDLMNIKKHLFGDTRTAKRLDRSQMCLLVLSQILTAKSAQEEFISE